jgi:hypothetical protein
MSRTEELVLDDVRGYNWKTRWMLSHKGCCKIKMNRLEPNGVSQSGANRTYLLYHLWFGLSRSQSATIRARLAVAVRPTPRAGSI